METKFSMEFTIKEWDSIISGLEKVEEEASKLKNNIVTGVNSQIAAINQAASKVEETNSTVEDTTVDVGGTTGIENEDNYNKTTVESDTTGEEDKIEGETK